MGLLAEAIPNVLRPRAEGWDPMDDRWYTPDLGLMTDAGVVLSAESILRCSTVLAAVRFLADAWATCPPQTFRRTAQGREEAPDHYTQTVLRNPNAWQTGNRWRHLNMAWVMTWGNAYNRIIPGRASWAAELRPIHPATCKVSQQRADGTLVYELRLPNAPPEYLGQERILHFRGLSTDGVTGVAMYVLIRNAVGIALAAEKHISMFLQKGSRLSGLVVPSTPLEKDQREELRRTINADLGGARNTGMFGVMPFGVDVKPISTTNRDAQLLELTDRQVGDLLRFLGVPGVAVGFADKTATYASAKEFFESGGMKHCVLPWVTNLEQEEQKALIPQGDPHYIRHNLDALQRGNMRDRYEAIYKAVGGPWQSVNEARETEDLNPSTDPQHDKILTPSNMMPDTGADSGSPSPAPADPGRAMRPAPPDDDADPEALARRAYQFALDAAARVVRREMAAIKGNGMPAGRGRGAALRFASDPAGWRAWVADLYERHVAHVAEQLHLPDPVARAYCERQRDALLAGGVAVVDAWEETVPPALAEIALESEGERAC